MNTHYFQHNYEQPMPGQHPSVSALVPTDQVTSLISELRQPQDHGEFDKVMNNFNDYFIERFTARNPVPKGQFPFGSVAQPTTVFKPHAEHGVFVPPYRPMPEYTPNYYSHPPHPVPYPPQHSAYAPHYSNYHPYPLNPHVYYPPHTHEYVVHHHEPQIPFRPHSPMQKSYSQARLRTAEPWTVRQDRPFAQSFARRSPERSRYEYSPQPQAWDEDQRGTTPLGSFKEMRHELENRLMRH